MAEQRSVKDLLIEMKDTSELMIDLAYSAVTYNSTELAEEVLSLETHIDNLEQQSYTQLMLSGRNLQEAEQLLGLLNIVTATEMIADAADDIATIVTANMPVPQSVRNSLLRTDEVTLRAIVEQNSAGKKVTDIEGDTGVRVIAAKRNGSWQFDPENGYAFAEDDRVFLRGPRDAVKAAYEDVAGHEFTTPEDQPVDPDLESVVEAITELKELVDLTTGLGYSAALFNNNEIADEVLQLEADADELKERVETRILEAAARSSNPSDLRGVHQIATSSEVITDAALDIASSVQKDMDPHPVLHEANRESDESILRVEVEPRSELADKTLVDTDLTAGLGMTVLAVRHHGRWKYNPSADQTVSEGDTVILRGPAENASKVHKLSAH